MCLAVPGRIVKIERGKAVVQYPGEVREVMAAGEPVQAGDWVLVQMGIIIQVLTPAEADEAMRVWA